MLLILTIILKQLISFSFVVSLVLPSFALAQTPQVSGAPPVAEVGVGSILEGNIEILTLEDVGNDIGVLQEDISQRLDEEIDRIESYIEQFEPTVVVQWESGDDGGGGGGWGGGGDGGGGDCFCSGTMIQMADGTREFIEDVVVGQMVRGAEGSENEVLETKQFDINGRTLYQLNGLLRLTPEHPVLTTKGWASLSPEDTKQVNPGLEVSKLNIGDTLILGNGAIELRSIDKYYDYFEDVVYSLRVSGDGTYIADGFVVHHNFK